MTASTARCTTAITSPQSSPSITVNIASVLFANPDSPDHPHRFGDDFADAFAHAQRCDGECDQYGHNTTLLAAHGSIGPMRVLVQRVSSATVSVEQHVVGSIQPDSQGLLAFVGVAHDDDIGKAQRLAEKLWQLRILDDDRSAADINAPIMVVSQFTCTPTPPRGDDRHGMPPRRGPSPSR